MFAGVNPTYASCTVKGSMSKSQALSTAAGYLSGAFLMQIAAMKTPMAIKDLKPQSHMAQIFELSLEEVWRYGRWLGEIS